MTEPRRNPVESVRRTIDELVDRTRFVVRAPLKLEFERQPEQRVFWELFHGRALDRGQTREQRVFEAWNIWDRTEPDAGNEPIVSVKWDHDSNQIHVIRGVFCRAWVATEDSGAILSRQVRKRVRELIGTIDLKLHADSLRMELATLLLQAVVGTSRLPLTSWESPLPEFQTGHLHYAGVDRIRDLEHYLRSGVLPNDAHSLNELIRSRTANELLADLGQVLNDTSLSPVTGWIGNLLQTLAAIEIGGHISASAGFDFCTRQLRLLFRHLNAFDLVRFHHRGANYPDAILLDALLRETVQRAVLSPEFLLPDPFDSVDDVERKRRRRFGLLAGWLLFDRYRGHLVPDRPTSTGENERIVRFANVDPVPDEQLADPPVRTAKLFEHDWRPSFNTGTVLQACAADLAEEATLRDLGLALFLDRPFGYYKRPGEPDKTPLLSYVASSRHLASQWLEQARRSFPDAAEVLTEAATKLRALPDQGVALPDVRSRQRPGVASLEDAALVACDFRFLTLTRRSWQLLTECFHLPRSNGFLLRSAENPATLIWYDDHWQQRTVFTWNPAAGFIHRRGIEVPASGLRIL